MILLRAVRWLVGAGQAIGEVVKLLRGLRRGSNVLVSTDETDPIPLTHKDAERIAEFGRRAGHETGPRPVPPPRKSSSRYDD